MLVATMLLQKRRELHARTWINQKALNNAKEMHAHGQSKHAVQTAANRGNNNQK